MYTSINILWYSFQNFDSTKLVKNTCTIQNVNYKTMIYLIHMYNSVVYMKTEFENKISFKKQRNETHTHCKLVERHSYLETY